MKSWLSSNSVGVDGGALAVKHEAAGPVTTGKLLLSIRTVLIGVFMLLIVVMAAAMIAVSLTTSSDSNDTCRDSGDRNTAVLIAQSRQLTTDLVSELMLSTVKRVESAAAQFTKWPQFGNEVSKDAEAFNLLTPTNLDLVLEWMWRQLLTFETVSFLNFADEDDNFVGVERTVDGEFRVELKNISAEICSICPPTQQGFKHYFFATKLEDGSLEIGAERRNKPYAPSQRSWFLAAKNTEVQGASAWSSVYGFSSGLSVGLTAVKGLYDDAGNLKIVVGGDIVLDFVGEFLADTKAEIGGNAIVFIIETDGDLIGVSTRAEITVDEVQIHASDFSEKAVRDSYAMLTEKYGGDLSTLPASGSHSINNGLELVAHVHFQDGNGLSWVLVVHLPVSDFTAEIEARQAEVAAQIAATSRTLDDNLQRNNAVNIGVSCGVLILGILLTYIITKRITQPLDVLSREMQDVARFKFTDEADESTNLKEISKIREQFRLMTLNLHSFSKYVPQDVVRMLAERETEAKLGVVNKEVTIFFSDIQNFTTIAESVSADDFMRLLSEYLSSMSSIIMNAEGTVGEFIGDAIMAFWNSPKDVVAHAKKTCQAALDQQTKLEALRKVWDKRGLPEIRTRMGIHTGSVLHGNIGCEERMKFGLVGDNVNLASRLEGMCKQYGVYILISGNTYEQVKSEYLCRKIDIVVAKGKVESTHIYELLANKSNANERAEAMCKETDEMWTVFLDRRFEQAKVMFATFSKKYDDMAAGKIAELCDVYIKEPPAADWDGSHALTEK